jgi:uncharacterized protein with HEPN domain
VSDGASREWRCYIDDMVGFAEKVLSYSQGFDQPGFVANSLHYDAALRNLELIGEPATHVPEEVRVAHPQIPWRLAIATRNRLIHGYLGIADVLWTIIDQDVPALLAELRALKATLA